MAEIEKEKEESRAAEGAAGASEGSTEKGETNRNAAVGEPPADQPAEAPGSLLNPPLAAGITIEDFVKVDLRVATVLDAERVPKADKLLRLLVDAGEGKPRQILAGIALHYSPEQMIGRKIVVVANLAPRKLRGLESNGMLLAASVGEDGKPVLVTFAEDVPNGARLK